MTKVNVFVSHSGVMGRAVAESVRDFLSNFENSIFEIELAPRSISSGMGWFAEITKKLKEANICLCIVDRNFKESSWCSFEVGYFASIKDESNVKKLFLLELPIQDANADLRGLTYPLAQIQSKPFERDTMRTLLDESAKIYTQLNLGKNDLKMNKQLDDNWDDFNNKINKIIETYLGENDDIPFDKSITITKDRAEYLKEELLDNIKYKLSDCLKDGFKNAGKNSLSKVFISFPLRLLHHLSLLLKEAAGGTISITDQNFFETMWADEIIDNVQKSIWATNLKGSNARKFENIEAQKNTVTRLKDKGVKDNSFTRIFIVEQDIEEEPEEMEELKKVIVAQTEIGINVGCILERDFRVFNPDLYACVGGLDFMVLDGKFVYVTSTHSAKTSTLSVKLLDNAQVPRAVRISNKINENPKTKFYNASLLIDTYFDNLLNPY